MILNNKNPIVVRRRKGTPDDPFVYITETHTVDPNSKVTLTEIPDRLYKVWVTAELGNWHEIKEGVLGATEFRVDYTNKLVTFHHSHVGKQFTFEYKGTGMEFIPTSMIYTKQIDGEVTQTLEDITEGASVVIEGAVIATNNANSKATLANEKALFAEREGNRVDTALSDLTQLKSGLDTSTQNANEKATYAQTQGDYAKNQGASASSAATTANEKANLANSKATLADQKATLANEKAEFANTQGTYAKQQGDYAKSSGDSAKTRWLNAVANYAAIATTYPSPSHGDTVQTLNDGKFYRREGNAWVFTQQITDTQIQNLAQTIQQDKTELLSEIETVNTQLAETDQKLTNKAKKVEDIVSILEYENLKVSIANGFDWTLSLNAAIDYARTNNIQQIKIPHYGDVYYFSDGFSIPDNMQIVGEGKPFMDFSLAGNKTAFELKSHTRLINVRLNGYDKASASTAVKFNGDHIKVNDLVATNFGTAIDFRNEHTYIITVSNSQLYNCGTIIDARLTMASTTNSGEKFIFNDCTFANSDVIIKTDSSTLDMFFSGCSFDYSADFGDFSNGQYFFQSCHFETDIARTPQGYLFKKRNGARMKFNNCRFGFVGISLIIDRATEGNSGYVSYQNCTAHFKKTDATNTVVSDSEHQVFVAGGQQTATFDSPFISRTVLGSVAIGFHSNNVARPLTTPTISFDANSTKGTVSFDTAPPSNTVVLVRFG